jgi:nitrate reductase cytochrome c-type subunit
MENCDVEQFWHANTQCMASQPTNRCLTCHEPEQSFEYEVSQ